ncbi:MAG: DUF4878 domain-containing protein [Phycisphaeraceae bacterium]
MTLVGCGGAGGGDPESVAEAFFAHIAAGEPDEAEALLVESERGPQARLMLSMMSQLAAESGLDSVTAIDVEQDGDRAVVTLEATVDGQTSPSQMGLERIDGQWYVSSPAPVN